MDNAFTPQSFWTTTITLQNSNNLSDFMADGLASWEETFLDDEMAKRVIFVNFCILCTSIAIFGICANVVNVTVFVKLGLPDTVSVSLCILAMADMASLFFLIWIATCFNPSFQRLSLPFDPVEVVYLTGGIPRHYFARVTGWITSVVAIERCVCVLKPLHVKLIFTKSRVTALLVILFFIALLTMVPVYYTSVLTRKFDPITNRTWMGFVIREGVDRHALDRVTFILGIIVSISAFAIVSSSTVILGWSLVKQSRWRGQTMTDPNQMVKGDKEGKYKKAAISAKDRQAVRTVTFIAAMFVICFLPHVVNLLLMSIVPEFNKHAKYEHFFSMAWSFAQMSEAICSSANIFVYWKTNTKYKATLKKIFLCDKSMEENAKFPQRAK